MDKPLWMWLTFVGIVFLLLAFDLGVLNKKDHEISVKESLWLCVFYVAIALLFGLWVLYQFGTERASEYYTGFLVEKSLALDNIFVISLIFTYFHIPRLYQHRVLFWGILGVIILRGIMIALGAALVSSFAWVLYIFAVFLIIIGIKTFFINNNKPDLSKNPLLKYLKKHFHITDEVQGNHFFVRRPHRNNPKKLVYWMTPLFVALILIEAADVIFAVDSIPAIFVITTDPFIVYTSNIFAILGLRALYFALDAILYRFKYLQYALGMVLIFIGSKIFIADLLGLEKFPALISLGITFGLLAGGVIYSIIKTNQEMARPSLNK